MKLVHDDIDDLTAGLWVRLVRDDTSGWPGYWPDPHRPGEVIHTGDGGRFVFDHVEPDADGRPEAVYTWAA